MAEKEDPLPECELVFDHNLELHPDPVDILDIDDLGLLPADLLLDDRLPIDDKPDPKCDSPTLDHSPEDLSNQEKTSTLAGLASIAYFKFSACKACGKKNLVFVLADMKQPACTGCLEKITGEDATSIVKTAWKLKIPERDLRCVTADLRNERLDEETSLFNQLLEDRQGKLQYLFKKMTACFELCKPLVDVESKVLAMRVLGETIENLIRLNSAQRLHTVQAKLEAMDSREQLYFKAELAKVAGPSDAKIPNIGSLGFPHTAASRKGSEAEGISLTKILPVHRSAFFDLEETVLRPYYLGKRGRKKSDLDLDGLGDADLTPTTCLNICTRLPF